jgi:hypothetical protein
MADPATQWPLEAILKTFTSDSIFSRRKRTKHYTSTMKRYYAGVTWANISLMEESYS